MINFGKNECEGCIHIDSCGIDIFFLDELELSDEERFKNHCLGCQCGDGLECNRNHGCENFEEESD